MSKTTECTFWKFVSHPVSMTHADAENLAKKIESGEFVPSNSYGERFYKLGGWCFDIGRKPYLVEGPDGHIGRSWALSVKELRQALYLTKRHQVVRDPFHKD